MNNGEVQRPSLKKKLLGNHSKHETVGKNKNLKEKQKVNRTITGKWTGYLSQQKKASRARSSALIATRQEATPMGDASKGLLSPSSHLPWC